MNYGTLENPNLEALDIALDKSLKEYQQEIEVLRRYEFELKRNEPFKLVPEKPYTGLTTVNVANARMREDYTMYVLLFLPGDGTGNDKDYSANELDFVDHTNFNIRFEDKQERVIPRKKDENKCAMEIVFPFFSVVNDNKYDNTVCLKELTINPNNKPKKSIIELKDIGKSKFAHYMTVSTEVARNHEVPTIDASVWYEQDGVRMGDPHSIFQEEDVMAMQVVGFLSLPKPDDPFRQMSRMVAECHTFSKHKK